MADILSLTAKIDLQTAAFTKGVNQVNKSMGRMESRFKRSSRAISGMAKGLAAAFSVRAISSFTKSALATADNIGKMSRTVGLSAEAFQELGHAAGLSGISMSSFESNMTAFVKRVGEAKNDMGPLVSGLKDVDAELLKSLQSSTSQEQALEILAEKMSKTSTAAERAAIANAAFGRSGIKMAELLKQGVGAIDDMRKTTSTMSNESIQAAERMNDVWSTKMNNIRIGAQDMAISFIDSISRMMTAASAMSEAELTRSIITTRKELEREYELINSGGIDPEGLAFTEDRIDSITGTMMEYVGQLNEMQQASLAAEAKVRALGKGFDDTGKKIEEAGSKATKAGGAAAKAVDKVKKAAKKADAELSEWEKTMESATSNFASGISDTLINSFVNGKFAFEDFAKSFLANTAKMILQSQILAALTGGKGFFSSLFGGSAPAVQKFAKGGVVNSPTGFAMPGGIGIAGEKGKEVIAPLKRDNQGNMGVAAAPSIINITTNNATVETQESTNQDGSRTLELLVKGIMAQSFGDGSMDRSMSGNYRVQRRGF